MKMVAMKCPECGASVNADLDKETAYCEFCGARLFLQNENEYTIHNVDEAEVMRARLEREKWEKSQEEEQKRKLWLKRGIIICLIAALVSFLTAFVLHKMQAKFMAVMVAVDAGMLFLAVFVAIIAHLLNKRR